MQRVENDQVEGVRRDAAQLRKLCEQFLPKFTSTRREVRLAPGAPTLVRAFWDELGYSPALEFLVAPPEEEKAVDASGLLEKWSARSKGQRRRGPVLDAGALVLPKSFRVVATNAEEQDLYYTDETAGDVDPPVFLISVRHGEKRQVSASYLRDVTLRILRLAFSVGPTRCTIAFKSPPAGELAFPSLSSTALRLGDGLWRILPEPAVGPMGEPLDFMGYASMDRFLSYMEGLPGDAIAEASAPRGDILTVENISEPAMLALGLKWFTWDSGGSSQRSAVGKVGGLEIWAEPVGPLTYAFTVTPASRKVLSRWMEKQGFRLQDTVSWKAQTALPGGGVWFG